MFIGGICVFAVFFLVAVNDDVHSVVLFGCILRGILCGWRLMKKMCTDIVFFWMSLKFVFIILHIIVIEDMIVFWTIMYIEDDSSGIPYPVEDYLFIHYYSFKYCAFDDKLALDILSEQ